jgi:hypothetical protein
MVTGKVNTWAQRARRGAARQDPGAKMTDSRLKTRRTGQDRFPIEDTADGAGPTTELAGGEGEAAAAAGRGGRRPGRAAAARR